MNNPIEEISMVGKGNMDAAMKLAELSVEAANQLMRLQMEAAKAFRSASVQALASAHDPKSMPNKLAEKGVESALDYSRKVYEIAAHTQQEIAAVMEERFNAMRQQMQGAITKMFEHAPGGAEPAINAMKAAFASSQNAFDAMSKAAKQGTDAAEANVKTVLTSAAGVTKKKVSGDGAIA